MKIVFASHNTGKIHELQALLDSEKIECITQSSLGIDDIEETGLSFIENALLKARHASKLSGLPVIADDSGLIVAALNGAPGIYSARYAGQNATAQQNIEKLLQELNSTPKEKRAAAFHCTLVYLSHAEDPTPLICQGTWHGTILTAPVGNQGFGYDPVFFDEKENCSAAQLPLEKKNRISHRGQALQYLLKKLPEKLCWHFL